MAEESWYAFPIWDWVEFFYMISESEVEQLSRQIGLCIGSDFLARQEVHFLETQADNLATFGVRAFISAKDRQELDRIFKKAVPNGIANRPTDA